MTAQQRSRQAWPKWRAVVSEQGRSGLSVAAYCQQARVCVAQFSRWKKRWCQAEAGTFVEVKRAAAEREPGAERGTGISGARLEVRLKNDRCWLEGWALMHIIYGRCERWWSPRDDRAAQFARRIGRGRRALANCENLPVTTMVHELSPKERACPRCGVERKEIGTDEGW